MTRQQQLDITLWLVAMLWTTMKLTGWWSWSWWWILSPLWLPPLAYIAFWLVVAAAIWSSIQFRKWS